MDTVLEQVLISGLASLELHVIMDIGKLTVLRTLVGSVGIQVLYGLAGDSLTVPDCILKEITVSKDCRLYLLKALLH